MLMDDPWSIDQEMTVAKWDLDFNGSLIPGLHRFVGDNPVLLVGNKEDLLPHSLKRSKIKDWMRQEANKQGLRPVDVGYLIVVA